MYTGVGPSGGGGLRWLTSVELEILGQALAWLRVPEVIVFGSIVIRSIGRDYVRLSVMPHQMVYTEAHPVLAEVTAPQQ